MWMLFLKQEPIAFLAGVAAVYYLDATTPGGDIFAFAIGFAAWSVIGLIGAALFHALGFGRGSKSGEAAKPQPDGGG